MRCWATWLGSVDQEQLNVQSRAAVRSSQNVFSWGGGSFASGEPAKQFALFALHLTTFLQTELRRSTML